MSNDENIPLPQFLSNKLIRSGKFKPMELSILMLVSTYSEECKIPLALLTSMVNRSIRTVQKAIDSLVSKGALTKRHGLFNRVILKTVDFSEFAD